MSFLHLLNARMTVQAMTPTIGPAGAAVPTWSNLASDVPCRLQPLRAERRLTDQQERILATHKVHHAGAQELDPSRRLVIDGVTYAVIAAAPARDGAPGIAWVAQVS